MHTARSIIRLLRSEQHRRQQHYPVPLYHTLDPAIELVSFCPPRPIHLSNSLPKPILQRHLHTTSPFHGEMLLHPLGSHHAISIAQQTIAPRVSSDSDGNSSTSHPFAHSHTHRAPQLPDTGCIGHTGYPLSRTCVLLELCFTALTQHTTSPSHSVCSTSDQRPSTVTSPTNRPSRQPILIPGTILPIHLPEPR